jgi:hypothetical protein
MKKFIFVFSIIFLLIFIFGCTGGCYPEKLKSLSVEPNCIEVFSGCVSNRLHLRNHCDSNFIITRIQSSNITSVPILTGNFDGIINSSKNGILEGRIILPKMLNIDPWIKQLTIDNINENFSITGEGINIVGSWDTNKIN